MKTKIQFGAQAPISIKSRKAAVKAARSKVVEDGLESNAFTTYDHEVKFENIKASVNICRVKDGDSEVVGVAKGAILSNVPVTVPTNDAAATMHAMKKRCDYSPKLHDISGFRRGHDLLMAKFDPLPEIRVDDALMERYFEKCGGSKALRLMDALNGHEWTYDGDTKHVFAKQEVLLKEHRAQPRVVYQGTDMYNALTGPVIMELNDRMKKTFSMTNPKNTGNIAIYACGVSGEELGDIMENARGVPLESDMKNNDGSQSAEFRRPEAMFYRKLGAPLWFVREFAKNTSVRVWTRYGVAAEVKGQRWSGETTTTTGNSYVSMALMQAALEKASISESTNIHGGDDYLGYIVGGDEKVEEGIKAVVSASGMSAEVVPQLSRHHATFYRKRYVRSNIGCRPVPQFGRVLAKLNLRSNRNSQVNDRDYMAGKYLSAAYEHRHVPIIKDLLVDTANTLSMTPHFDVRISKLNEMGCPEDIKRKVSETRTHSADEFGDYLSQVYGIGLDDLVDVYARVAQSCVDYCDGWTRVDTRTGKIKNVERNNRYVPVKLCGDVIEALVRLDT